MVEPAKFVDIHCHLLAGLDDGPRTLADAVAMCRLGQSQGTVAFAATAHQLGCHGAVTRQRILDATVRLANELRATGISATVYPSAEWMIDTEWFEDPSIDPADLVTINDGQKYALIEFPYHPPPHTALVAERLGARGVTPILAHVDRYPTLLRDPRAVRRLIDEGFVIQMNGAALEGKRSEGVRWAARGLVAQGLVHLVASDAHDSVRRTPDLAPAHAIARGLVGSATARLLFEENPTSVIEGRPTVRPEPATWRRQIQRWFR